MRELSARTSRTLLAFWSAARMKMEERNETRGFSWWRAFEYQALLREGGRMLSRTEVRDGGALRRREEDAEAARARWGETGRATTWVAKVMAEIQREESRGSREEGKRDQNLSCERWERQPGYREIDAKRIYSPARIGALWRM